MKILITGGGLLGASVAKHFSRLGHRCLVIDQWDISNYLTLIAGKQVSFVQENICNEAIINALVKEYRPAVIVHTAAIMGNQFSDDSLIARQVNLDATLNLAKSASLYGVKHFIFASSLAVYDFDDRYSRIDEFSPKTQTDAYGLYKLQAEADLQRIAQETSVQVTILRFSGMYGYCPGLGGAWMSRLINDLITQLETGDDSTLIVNGEHLGWNEYLYADDAAAAVVAATSSKQSLCLNVGAEKITSPENVTRALQKLYPHRKLSYVPPTGPMPSFKTRAFPLDMNLMHRHLRWRHLYQDVLSGLRETILMHRIARQIT